MHTFIHVFEFLKGKNIIGNYHPYKMGIPNVNT